MDLADVTGETIEAARLEDKQFEQFVRQLLRAERGLRHRPDAEVKGPVAKYRPDHQRDLVFEVHAPPTVPRVEFSAALTWDEPGRTWYSCKGGARWREAILTELGRRAFRAYLESNQPPGDAVKNRPPAKLLDHLAAGGRYVLVVSSPEIDDDGLLEQVAQLLGFWLEQGQPSRGPRRAELLRDQLGFIDANRIADFISSHKPTTLSEEFRALLKVRDSAGLKSWAQWTDELAGGRDLPEFEVDEERAGLFADFAGGAERIIRVFGPPGAGKTRAVHEAILRGGDEARARTRYCADIEVNLRLVEDPWLRTAGPVCLVLDELRSIDVDPPRGPKRRRRAR